MEKYFAGCGKIRNFALATEGAQVSSEFFIDIIMIEKALVQNIVTEALEGTDLFLVELSVSADNCIVVDVDSMAPMDVDTVAALSRKIEEKLDRDVEDFELEVGSAGLTSPFKVKQQYVKNLGNDVEVLTRDGRKFSGRLVEAGDADFVVEVARKVKPEGAKRPVTELQPERVAYENAKSVKYIIKF